MRVQFEEEDSALLISRKFLVWDQILREEGVYSSPDNPGVFLVVLKEDACGDTVVLYMDDEGQVEPADASTWSDECFVRENAELKITLLRGGAA